MITKPGVYTRFDPTGKEVKVIAKCDRSAATFEDEDNPVLDFFLSTGEECVEGLDGSLTVQPGGPTLTETKPAI